MDSGSVVTFMQEGGPLNGLDCGNNPASKEVFIHQKKRIAPAAVRRA